MTDDKRPGIGLLLIVVSAALFWGSAAGCVGYAYARHNETQAIKSACQELITYGWNVSIRECVKDLRP